MNCGVWLPIRFHLRAVQFFSDSEPVNCCRVWSTDWWIDKHSSLERLDAQLRSLLDRSREKDCERRRQAPIALSPAPPPEATGTDLACEVLPSPVPAEFYARSVGTAASLTYCEADLSTFSAVLDPASFHEPVYDVHLRTMVTHVLSAEAPISGDALVTRIARAHGFQRSGNLIRDRVLDMTERYHHIVEDPAGVRFAWFREGDPGSWRSYRVPAQGAVPRTIEEIPLEEIRAAALVAQGDDPVVEVARLLGMKRLGTGVRRRIIDAIGVAARIG